MVIINLNLITEKIIKISSAVMYCYFFALHITDIKSDKKESSKQLCVVIYVKLILSQKKK